MAEQVSEAHDGVLSVLDQMLLGSVTDVLIISCSLHVRGEQTYHLFTGIGDSTRNLPLSILVGDTDWVALFVNDSDGSVRLAKVDTENGGTGSPRDELDSDTLCLHFIYDRDGLRDLVKKVRRFFVSFKLSRACGTRIPGDGTYPPALLKKSSWNRTNGGSNKVEAEPLVAGSKYVSLVAPLPWPVYLKHETPPDVLIMPSFNFSKSGPSPAPTQRALAKTSVYTPCRD